VPSRGREINCEEISRSAPHAMVEEGGKCGTSHTVYSNITYGKC
jgi:hypothetical protein